MFSEALDNAVAKIKEAVRPAERAGAGEFNEEKFKTHWRQ
jgi:hypothetical protein